MMIEVSLLLFTIITEALVICLILLILWTIVTVRNKKRDRTAAKKLIDQVKHQSQTRLETTSSFLNEKYRFEGNELKKAVKSIDKAEKRFIQKIINIYLQRDVDGLASMDASMAEMIDTYKSLSPVMPDAGTMASLDTEAANELAELRESKNKLNEELAITKETMSNMISEFGNMFGGGKDHELAKHEVVEKFMDHELTPDTSETDDGDNDIEIGTVEQEKVQLDSADESKIESGIEEQSHVSENAQIRENNLDEEVVADDEVDELLNSIDLSNGK